MELFLINHQGSPFQVNVNVLGSTNGVSTDFDGKFQLPNAKKRRKIVFSYYWLQNLVINYDKISNGFSGGRCKSLNEVAGRLWYLLRKDATGVSQILRTLIKGKRNPESLISGRIGC
jgi:iron complex outermembrane receptor protein